MQPEAGPAFLSGRSFAVCRNHHQRSNRCTPAPAYRTPQGVLIAYCSSKAMHTCLFMKTRAVYSCFSKSHTTAWASLPVQLGSLISLSLAVVIPFRAPANTANGQCEQRMNQEALQIQWQATSSRSVGFQRRSLTALVTQATMTYIYRCGVYTRMWYSAGTEVPYLQSRRAAYSSAVYIGGWT